MKVAVTGATGFVGRHVVTNLRQRGLEPVVVVRPGRNIPKECAGLEVAEIDVIAPPANPFAVMHEPEIVMHLAWSGLPNYQSPHHLERELPAQTTFLKAAINSGLRNVLVTGTCLEYGLQSGELREEMEARPTTSYGAAKNSLRLMLEAFQQFKPFNLTWARLFYLYGAGQADSSIYSQLRKAAERGAEQFDMSGGAQLRDYLPVEDAADHLVTLALLGRNLGCVNVCSGQPVTMHSLVNRWIREHHWRIEPNLGQLPYPDYEPMQFWGSPSRLRQMSASE